MVKHFYRGICTTSGRRSAFPAFENGSVAMTTALVKKLNSFMRRESAKIF